MLATAHYWDQRLVNENGYYNVVGSAQNENSSYTLNPTGDLSNLRGLYTALIDMNQSGAVTSSASDLALWETELANLAPLPTFTYNGHTDLKATEDAPGFYGGDAMPVNGAVWAPVLGLGSPSAQLQALRNTIYDLGDNANIWYQNNSIGWIYPAAARAGLPDTFSRLTAIATGRTGEPGEQQVNGTVVYAINGAGGGGGAGNIEAVDEMLLSSYDGVLRFFPAWPMARTVSFSNMAAVGDFQVSSGVLGGIIQPTTVVSSAGRTLTIAQPWTGATITITDNSTGVVVSGNAATLSTPTAAGHSYAVAFSGGSQPAPDLAELATASASSDIGSIDWWAGYANDGQTASMLFDARLVVEFKSVERSRRVLPARSRRADDLQSGESLAAFGCPEPGPGLSVELQRRRVLRRHQLDRGGRRRGRIATRRRGGRAVRDPDGTLRTDQRTAPPVDPNDGGQNPMSSPR